MSLKTITKLVVSYSEIPKELTANHWINQVEDIERIEVHIDDEEPDPLTSWLIDNYPELKDEESFFIHMDHLL